MIKREQGKAEGVEGHHHHRLSLSYEIMCILSASWKYRPAVEWSGVERKYVPMLRIKQKRLGKSVKSIPSFPVPFQYNGTTATVTLV